MSVEVIVRRNVIGRVASRIRPTAERRKRLLIRRVWELDRQFAPVDTGELQSKIEETPDGVVGRAAHDIHQEFGTRYQRGTPHHRPAARQGAAEVGRFFDGFETEITAV